jgi:transmembrane sensor
MENKNTNLKIEETVVKYITGTATGSERQEVLSWLKESNDNRRYFDELKDIYEAAKSVQESTSYNTEKSWERVKSKHYRHQLEKLQENNSNDSRKLWKEIMRYAAIFTVAITALFYGLFLTKGKPLTASNDVWSTIEAPFGSRAHLTLADSTEVWLNAGSKLRYRSSFAKNNRKVYLDGEAYFNVSHDDENQFVVKTSHVDIKVFGTEFNVKAYASENIIQTTLVKGSITLVGDLINKSGRQSVELKPNQTATYYITGMPEKAESSAQTCSIPREELIKPVIKSENLVILPKVNTAKYTSWKDPRWFIDGETMAELAVKLERRYNVKFVFNSANLEDYRFSGTLKDETLEQVLNLMRLTSPINYSIENNVVVLSENKYFRKSYDRMLTKQNN